MTNQDLITEPEVRRPLVGEKFNLSGSVKVDGWSLGDTLEILEYVGVDGADNHVALCRNITKDNSDYIDTDHLDLKESN